MPPELNRMSKMSRSDMCARRSSICRGRGARHGKWAGVRSKYWRKSSSDDIDTSYSSQYQAHPSCHHETLTASMTEDFERVTQQGGRTRIHVVVWQGVSGRNKQGRGSQRRDVPSSRAGGRRGRRWRRGERQRRTSRARHRAVVTCETRRARLNIARTRQFFRKSEVSPPANLG